MNGPMNSAIERGWHEVAAVAGVLVDVTLIDAGLYDVTTGDQSDSRVERSVLAVGGPVTWRQIESGAALRGDRFVQVCAASMPRALRADDLIGMADGSTWKVKSTVDYGAIVEAVIGKA